MMETKEIETLRIQLKDMQRQQVAMKSNVEYSQRMVNTKKADLSAWLQGLTQDQKKYGEIAKEVADTARLITQLSSESSERCHNCLGFKHTHKDGYDHADKCPYLVPQLEREVAILTRELIACHEEGTYVEE